MSYAHNEEADFAASQLARMFVDHPDLCHTDYKRQDLPKLSAFATGEGSRAQWPLADGVIVLTKVGKPNAQKSIALEYKRPSEGIHGLLTAVGQTLSYIHKGYSGAVMVIPREYTTLNNPADFVKSVFSSNKIDSRIGIFDYSPPDKNSPYPFADRMRCVRPFTVGEPITNIKIPIGKKTTQWVHIREGSTTRDVLCGYLQASIRLSLDGDKKEQFDIPQQMIDAVRRIQPSADESNVLPIPFIHI